MSEMEKMCENAGIKKKQNCSHSDTCYNGSLQECEGCNAYKYPPFTAEKQLEILKYLAHIKINDYLPLIELDYDEFDCIWYLRIKIPLDSYMVNDKDFEVALAKLVNLIWQSLTEEERNSIKGILE